MPTLNELRDSIHKNAVEHGFYDEERKPHSEAVRHAFTAQKIALIHSELSEALEADRKGKYAVVRNFDFAVEDLGESLSEAFEHHVKDTFEDEIADTIIRLLDLCGAMNINIDKYVEMKMKYNEFRPRKHGKEY